MASAAIVREKGKPTVNKQSIGLASHTVDAESSMAWHGERPQGEWEMHLSSPLPEVAGAVREGQYGSPTHL